MQATIKPKLSKQTGHAVWCSVLAEVNAQQLSATTTRQTIIRLAALCGLLGGALAMAWSSTSSLWMLSAAYLLIALLLAQAAFIGHSAGHGSISRNDRLNRTLGQFSMTLLTGLAFDEWIARHRDHHRYCQDEDQDPDLMVDLFVSLTDKSRCRKGRLGRFLTRYQAVHIWLLSLLFGHSQRHLSQAAVLRKLQRYRLDAAMLLLHLALWFGLPCLVLDVPVRLALLAYLVPLTILGPYLAAIFWVNHMGMPLIEDASAFSFLEHQTVTSRTILNAPRWDWLFGGLNFQIEHHLFPKVPTTRLAAVQTIVRRHFDEQGIAYHGVSWRAAVSAIHAHLRKMATAS
ncbi:Fatty acid desaturase [Oxalobacteraceae bacterium IMCC9480]|nr:Fatty acid desaturase [Oxalobacteraceae bacterium IMCC9480]NDP59019.1 acyl-CoA desaturase [Oxalobacteraceae bacterium]